MAKQRRANAPGQTSLFDQPAPEAAQDEGTSVVAPGSFWDGAEILSVYTRDDLNADHDAVSVVRVGEPRYDEQGNLRDLSGKGGIENRPDGQFVDLDVWGAQAGLPRIPTLLDQQIWADIQAIPSSQEGLADLKGRLWDVIAGAGLRAQMLARQGKAWEQIAYAITLPVRGRRRRTYYLLAIHDRAAPLVHIKRDERAEAAADRQAATRRIVRQMTKGRRS
jgi:hypothetical protein